MTNATKDQTLREMAAHRGFKLVKSRKRKVGADDYGKYGLTDAGGKPLLGIGDDGFTASLEDIEAFLREGATSTWKASADAMPARATPARKATTATHEKVEPALRPRAKRATGHTPTPSKKIAARPTPEPAPLSIRAATSADAADMAALLCQLAQTAIDEHEVAHNLERISKAGGGLIVAVLEGIVGCCAWTLIPTLHHGVIGRITVLLVDGAHRRRGIATAMLDAATTVLREAGCTRIEAMSDIEIKNAHNFFRASKFEQTSYRFARAIDAEA
jgi:ribosomal protein S18 acetylase RimI-like enzyme